MRNALNFKLDNEWVTLENDNPTLTLLDYLRLQQLKTGVKEGCNEGDCGACTVLIGQVENGKMHYKAINSCIKLLNSCDSTHIVTIHHLKKDKLHPVQQAFIECHASQCGFCTPGFIMSLYALYLSEGTSPPLKRIEEVIAGNLCRCTGYVSIINAAKRMYELGEREQPPVLEFSKQPLSLKGYDAPQSLNDALTLLQQKPLVIAGTTDVGLWITKDHQRPLQMLDISRVEELKNIDVSEANITIGTGVSLTRVKDLFATLHPDLHELMRRFGGEQVRNSGTIGGNIGNGSPIGDLPPLLIVLSATLKLTSLSGSREIPLESFFLDYKKQDLREGEMIESVSIPLPLPKKIIIHKISKRKDEDISTLLFAYSYQNEHRIAFGGMAGVPKRAYTTEKSLNVDDLDKDFTPLSDVRASSEYRMKVAKNLVREALR